MQKGGSNARLHQSSFVIVAAANVPRKRVSGRALMLGTICVAAAAGAVLALTARAPTDELPPIVRAERSGLRFDTEALTGRVTLIATTRGVRWRIVGITEWRQAPGRVLVRDWDTTQIRDGTYRLELKRAGLTAQRLVVRNYTPIRTSPLANASAGLDRRSTDDRAVAAAFSRRSYRPGAFAVLELWGRYERLRIQVLRIGPAARKASGNEAIIGMPMGAELRVAGSSRSVRLRMGDWASGLYVARLAAGTRVGYAPFILRPARLGTSPVAVVQPTNTWQAYNYRCADGDGIPDTWYYTQRCTTVDQSRPYLDQGVPPHFRAYDLGFLRWLARRGKAVDMLAQDDIERISGDRLARLYRLIVFPGHHEYVTTAEYDAVQRFRDLGGNLAFLSANNFFYRVDRHGDRITRIARWRDLGRPEAALVGVQYFRWNLGKFGSRHYVVRGANDARWLFAGTGLRNGDSLGWWGIEVDGRSGASPRSIKVLASMPNAMGTRRPAEMTYYETSSGARVFASGAFTLAGTQATRWTTGRLLENLWDRLDGVTPRHGTEAALRARG